MEAKLQRAVKDLRADLERDKGGLVKVFADQLSLVLDALAPESVEIREGDRVEITEELGGVGSFNTFIYPGVQGTVVTVNEHTFKGAYNYLVALDTNPEASGGYAFAGTELKKVG